MNPSYRRDKDHNYMILETQEKISGNEYQVRMLLLNRIEGLLPCHMRMMDGTAGFYYEITSKQPMARVFEKARMKKEDIQKLLCGISRAISQAERYLLEADHFIPEPDYIYMDVETKEVSLCYLPFYDGNIKEGFRTLSEYVLKHVDSEQEEAVLWAHEIYNKAAKENYSLEEILESREPGIKKKENIERQSEEEDEKEEIYSEVPVVSKKVRGSGKYQKEKHKKEKHKKEIYQIGKLAAMAVAGIMAAAAIVVLAVKIGGLNLTQTGGIIFLLLALAFYFAGGQKTKRGKKKEKPGDEMHEVYRYFKRQKYDEEEEDPLIEVSEDGDALSYSEVQTGAESRGSREESYGMTTVLQTGWSGDCPVLVSMDTSKGENIVLDREELSVGKVREQADIVLKAATVSRIHAKLTCRDGVCTVMDLNSTNGTYVNGRRLESMEVFELQMSDEVFFASAGYYFKG